MQSSIDFIWVLGVGRLEIGFQIGSECKVWCTLLSIFHRAWEIAIGHRTFMDVYRRTELNLKSEEKTIEIEVIAI